MLECQKRGRTRRFMPNKLSITNQTFKYLLAIISFTILAFLLITRSAQITDLITEYHTSILIAAIIVLLVAVVIQKKQTDILRENERLFRALQEKQAYIDRDMAMARKIQQAILDEPLPEHKNFAVAARCLPAEKIGGDFYNIRIMGDELHFFIGDVSGHGISSALVMALAHGIMNEIITYLNSPAQILTMTNKVLHHYLKDSINFVTLFYGKINLKTKELTCCGAGHPPVLHFRKDGKLTPLPARGAILGMFTRNSYKNIVKKLQPGDKLILYTDGFLECEAGNCQLGEKKFQQIVSEYLTLPPAKLKDKLYERITAESTKIKDDLSCIVIELR